MTRRETVGIVGSGPSGMTAAQELAEAGFEVHVYEMMNRLGGMMTWGIPAFRLPPGTIEEDMQRILKRCPGIKVHLNCALGKDITLEALKARHDAVLLTIGSWWGKSMGIPGDDHAQVVDGVGFLRRVNDGERPTLPETVLVIGGGDVAMDACRVAKRLPGCKNVQVIYRRGPNEIPARKDELHGALKDARLLADVYLALSGGQAALGLDATPAEGAALAAVPVARGSIRIPVVRANAAELAAHEASLAAIERASNGAALFRNVKGHGA